MSSDKNQVDPGELVKEILGGFDIISNRPGQAAAAEALKQIRDERSGKKVEAAKGLYTKFIEAYEQIQKSKKAYEGGLKKQLKELEQIAKKIQGFGGGGKSNEEASSDDAGASSAD